MANPQDEHEKDPVDWLIIISGCVVGIFILYGFIVTLISFLHWSYLRVPKRPIVVSTTSPQAELLRSPDYPYIDVTPTCSGCFSLTDNQSTFTLSRGEQITLELPGTYPEENLVVVGNPPGDVIILNRAEPKIPDDWAVMLQGEAAGAADIVVRPTQGSLPNFHIFLIIK